MKKNIISIDEEKCIGCGQCVNTCHQGALALIDKKAKLISESYCDGLGRCLPKCPVDAIKIIEKEVEKSSVKKELNLNAGFGCPSANAKEIKREEVKPLDTTNYEAVSQLRQWPCQIKLVPVNAPYLSGAKLLIAADCTAFANANIHDKFMKNKITLIGCPKLDEGDYAQKLTEILKNNDIKSVDILRMSVPCCGGLENAVKRALMNSGKMIPWGVHVISTNGEILE